MFRTIFLIQLIFLFSPVVFAELPEEAKTCGSTSIQPAAEGLPENYAAFIGVHSGKWADKLPSTLIVKSVDKDGKMKGYYSWGVYRPWNISSSGCDYVTGIVKEDELEIRNGDATITYIYSGDFFLGIFNRRGKNTPGKFYPVK